MYTLRNSKKTTTTETKRRARQRLQRESQVKWCNGIDGGKNSTQQIGCKEQVKGAGNCGIENEKNTRTHICKPAMLKTNNGTHKRTYNNLQAENENKKKFKQIVIDLEVDASWKWNGVDKNKTISTNNTEATKNNKRERNKG